MNNEGYMQLQVPAADLLPDAPSRIHHSFIIIISEIQIHLKNKYICQQQTCYQTPKENHSLTKIPSEIQTPLKIHWNKYSKV